MAPLRSLAVVAFLSIASLGNAASRPAAVPGKTAGMAAMTWYHPLLEPGLSEVTLVCTVVRNTRGPDHYGGPYWNVRLRIDERIYIDKAFAERLANVRYLEEGDFRRRKVGERIVFFGGIGEFYEGEDFLMPCWSGTSTDLGILLHSKDDLDADENDRLLEALRSLAQSHGVDSDVLEAFAAFAPKGVAHTLIREKRHQEFEADEAALEAKDATK